MTQPTLFDHPAIPLCEPRPDEDLCFNKHGGNELSIQAHARVRKSRDRSLIYGYIKASGTYGITLYEMSVLLDRECNRISGRFTELVKAGEIVKTERTRLTGTGSLARVYVAAP